MAVSLELTPRFSTIASSEWAWRLPADLRMRGGSSKWLLRQVLYQYAPRELSTGPRPGLCADRPLAARPAERLGGGLHFESALRADDAAAGTDSSCLAAASDGSPQ